MSSEKDDFSITSIEKIHKAIELVGDNWTIAIIYQLMNKPRRFNELADIIPLINRATLSARLKKLISNGIISRQVGNENPPTSTYYLTPLGMGLKQVIIEIDKFSEHFLN
jgi:DNA-binding HxlR family transcriptional regulator